MDAISFVPLAHRGLGSDLAVWKGGGGGKKTRVLPNLVDKFVARGEPCAPSHSQGGSGVGVGAPSTAQHKRVDKKAGLFVQGIAIDFVLNTFCSATGVSGLCPL